MQPTEDGRGGTGRQSEAAVKVADERLQWAQKAALSRRGGREAEVKWLVDTVDAGGRDGGAGVWSQREGRLGGGGASRQCRAVLGPLSTALAAARRAEPRPGELAGDLGSDTSADLAPSSACDPIAWSDGSHAASRARRAALHVRTNYIAINLFCR